MTKTKMTKMINPNRTTTQTITKKTTTSKMKTTTDHPIGRLSYFPAVHLSLCLQRQPSFLLTCYLALWYNFLTSSSKMYAVFRVGDFPWSLNSSSTTALAACLSVCLSVCLCVCLSAAYSPQFWCNVVQIFRKVSSLPGIEMIKFWTLTSLTLILTSKVKTTILLQFRS